MSAKGLVDVAHLPFLIQLVDVISSLGSATTFTSLWLSLHNGAWSGDLRMRRNRATQTQIKHKTENIMKKPQHNKLG